MVTGIPRKPLQARRHLLLRLQIGAQPAELLDVVLLPLAALPVRAGAGEGGIHDDQIEIAVPDLGADARGGLLADAARPQGRVAGVEERRELGRLQQFERTDLDAAVLLTTVGNGVQPRQLEGAVGPQPGERRAGDVHRRGHHIAAVEDLLHQRAMERRRVAPGAFVPRGDLLVHRREQRPGAAGEVPHAESAEAVGVRPIQVVQQRHREARQQRGRRRKRVEGGEVLPIGDEPLEDAPGEVVGVRDAERVDLGRGLAEPAQDPGAVAGQQVRQEIPRDGEDRPVVDRENLVPGRANGPVRVDDGVAHFAGGPNPGQDSGQSVVEDDGIRQDGPCHAPRLRGIVESQARGDLIGKERTQDAEFVQPPGHLLDPLLHRRGGGPHRFLRLPDEPNQVGEILHGPLEPTRPGKPRPVRVVGGEGQIGIPQGRFDLVGVLQRCRVSQRHDRFDRTRLADDAPMEPGTRFFLDGRRRFVLRLDDHRRGAGAGYQEIRPAGMAREQPGVLRPDRRVAEHSPQQRPESAVGVGFDLTDHVALRNRSLLSPALRNPGGGEESLPEFEPRIRRRAE